MGLIGVAGPITSGRGATDTGGLTLGKVKGGPGSDPGSGPGSGPFLGASLKRSAGGGGVVERALLLINDGGVDGGF